MCLSLFRQLKLVHRLGFGFGLLLLCMMLTLGVNLAANTQHQVITDHLIDHLYPARSEANRILRLALTIDDNGAQYLLSYDPHQQAQLLQTYQQDVQALRVAVAKLTVLADTPEQRSAMDDFTQFFFGNGGYYALNQQAFAQNRAGQELTASDSYAHNPFLPTIRNDIQVYVNVVDREIIQKGAEQEWLARLVQFLNIGLGGGALLCGVGIALFTTRSIGHLYLQIEEKNIKLAENNTHLQSLARTDPLTELPNHRALLSMLKQELERAQRYSRSCALLFLDIDHFKALNDSYGHAAGDTVLREFASVLSTTIRSVDSVGRWGGEEFVVILPEATPEEALDIAEGIRKAVSFHAFEISGGLHLTCSIGVACYPDHACDQDALMTAADQAMYGAKRLGRNQVRALNDPAVTALFDEAADGGREESALRGTVEALITLVEERDISLRHHTQQVAGLVRDLSLAMEMSVEEVQVVALAGLLHDIGKVAIPDAILQKPGPLTDEEWAQMRRHSVVGAEVIGHIPSIRPLVPVIRAHYERWDGHGYPDHLEGEEIPFAARLIAVADAYTVMITDRPYQQACSSADALVELRRCAGTQFDPQMVEALINLVQNTQNQQQLEAASVA